MKTKTKKLDRALPERWQKAVEIYLRPGPPFSTMAGALLEAGFSKGTAYHHANRIFGDPRVERLLKIHWDEEHRRWLESLKQRHSTV